MRLTPGFGDPLGKDHNNNHVFASLLSPSTPHDAEILTTFALFPQLPLELRLTIWRHASFLPRELDVWGKQIRRDTFFSEHTNYKFISTPTPPIVRHTSHDARQEGLKHYQLAFGKDTAGPASGLSDCAVSRIYLNPVADRVCFFGKESNYIHHELYHEMCMLVGIYQLRRLTVRVSGGYVLFDSQLVLEQMWLLTLPPFWFHASSKKLRYISDAQKLASGQK